MILSNYLNIFYSKSKFFTNKMILNPSFRMKSVVVDRMTEIMTIGINRPEKNNALDKETCDQLLEAIETFEKDDEVLIGVLYGKGGNFCSGYDISLFEREDFTFSYLFPTGKYFKKPIIAAIDGYAVAAGLELALMCDLRVMEETAKIGFLSRRFGIPLMEEGTVRIQKMLGTSRSLDLIMTGRVMSADEALEWGIVNRLVACGTGFGQAVNLAFSLLKFPQDSLNYDRQSLYYNTFEAKNFQEACEHERKDTGKFLEKDKLKKIFEKFNSGVGKHGKFKDIS